MPVVIDDYLPAKTALLKESIYTISKSRAKTQDIRPIRIAILNLMPNKDETEKQLLRALSNTPIQIHVDFIRMSQYESKHTDREHLELFYQRFSEIKHLKYDGMIITGAPVEQLEFEEVHYWEELQEIFEYARTNVYSSLFICWAAQAALYHYYGIQKNASQKKIFGVYEYDILQHTPLTRGLDDSFYSPQSRYTYTLSEDIKHTPDLMVISSREDTGVCLASSLDHRLIFMSGHNEYDKDSLYKEYLRDLDKGLSIDPPVNYFMGEPLESNIHMKWRAHSSLLFSNWINYCIYESTPYELEAIAAKKVVKFGGTSLCDSDQYQKVKDIITSEENRSVVVVSAPGKRFPGDIKVTDLLIAYFECSDFNEKENILSIIRARYLKIVRNLSLNPHVIEDIDITMESIETSRDLDFVLSRGEYLSAKLMACYLGYTFLDASNLIYFQEDGSVDVDKTNLSICKTIGQDMKVVIPGFYGTDIHGKIKTFKRGGSDITGSIIAGALQALVYENWTDVDGLMDKDPRKHSDATLIERLSYDEFIRISEIGDQVYHIDAIRPIMTNKIPLNIRNTNAPDKKGTFVAR